MKGERIKAYVLQLRSGRTLYQTCEDRRWYLSNKPALDWRSMWSVKASKTVPVTDGAAPAAERLAWGGNLWLWRQWRRRWRIQAGKPPTLSLWLLYSSQDSRPHPEKQNHTRWRSPGSRNTFLLFDFTWEQENKRHEMSSIWTFEIKTICFISYTLEFNHQTQKSIQQIVLRTSYSKSRGDSPWKSWANLKTAFLFFMKS